MMPPPIKGGQGREPEDVIDSSIAIGVVIVSLVLWAIILWAIYY